MMCHKRYKYWKIYWNEWLTEWSHLCGTRSFKYILCENKFNFTVWE